MAQAAPTYGYATGKSEELIIDALIEKYGSKSVSWPIVLIKDGEPYGYLYEKNKTNRINEAGNLTPVSRSGLTSYRLDYCGARQLQPPDPVLNGLADRKYACSYDFILNSPDLSTVDLDYVWYTGKGFKGFELTTFFVDFETKQRAEGLVARMSRRPSWQSENGARAFRRIVDSASDLGVEYYMVCANTVSKVGSALKTGGNVLYFRMTHEQIDRIESGEPPMDSTFCSFQAFLSWL